MIKMLFKMTYGLEMMRIQIVYVYDLGILCCQESFGMGCENNIYHICTFNYFLMII